MFKGLKFALLSCLFLLPVFLKAHADELRIGYVNIERIMRETPAAIAVGKKMEQEFEGRKQELQRTAEDIKSRQAAFSDKGLSLSDSQRRTKQDELAELTMRFQRSQKAFQEDIKVRQNEEKSAFAQKANKAIVQIAEAERLDIVFQEAIVVGKKVDLTDKVIKRLSEN